MSPGRSAFGLVEEAQEDCWFPYIPLPFFLVPGLSAAPWIGSQEIVEQEIPRLHHSG